MLVGRLECSQHWFLFYLVLARLNRRFYGSFLSHVSQLASENGVNTCLQVDSDLLKDNPWGDPHCRDVWVYVPTGYTKSRPIMVMFLSGFAGTGEGIRSNAYWALFGYALWPLDSRSKCPPIYHAAWLLVDLFGAPVCGFTGNWSYASHWWQKFVNVGSSCRGTAS